MREIHLLLELTKAQFKLQHESSYLGVLWYLLGPLLLFLILLFVFSQRLGVDIEQYPLYLLLGLVLWNVFATGTGRSLGALKTHAGLLKSFRIRKELLVIAAVLTALISHLFELVVFAGFSLWFGVVPSFMGIVSFLLVLLCFVFFTLGVGFALSGLYVQARDIAQIWSIFSRVLWFATPIFYALTETGIGRTVSLFNPVYYAVHLSREVLIYGRPLPLTLFLVFVLYAAVSIAIGYAIFRRCTTKSLHLL